MDNSAKSANPSNNSLGWNNGNNKYACKNTKDKIFLLSVQELTNDAYALRGDSIERKTTDYAKSQGVSFYRITGTVSYAASWWLRSPFYGRDNAAQSVEYHIDSSYSVYVGCGAYNVSYTECGVVPALWMDI